jgi:hypothetical protein
MSSPASPPIEDALRQLQEAIRNTPPPSFELPPQLREELARATATTAILCAVAFILTSIWWYWIIRLSVRHALADHATRLNSRSNQSPISQPAAKPRTSIVRRALNAVVASFDSLIVFATTRPPAPKNTNTTLSDAWRKLETPRPTDDDSRFRPK